MFSHLALVVAAGLLGPILAHGRRGLVPVVIGELALGAALGHTGLGLIDPGASAFPVFYNLGFTMLMLTAGTHVDLRSAPMRQGAARGALALLVVAALALPVGLALAAALGNAHPLLLAVLLAGSSAAVAFPIIEERGLTGPAVSFLIGWLALADTVTVVLMPLTLVGGSGLLKALAGDALIVAAAVALYLAAVWLRGRPQVQEMAAESRTRGWALQLRLSVLVLLLLGSVAESTGASNLVAGFLAGIIVIQLGEPDRLMLQISGLANGFFVPIFFVLLGARLDLRALATDPTALVLVVAMAAGAVAVHLAAARLAAPSRWFAAGLAGSAQLGLPAAAAALGISSGALRPATAAALVAAGCLTLLPAAVGGSLLASRGSVAGAEAGDRQEQHDDPEHRRQ